MAKYKFVNIDLYKREIAIFIGTHADFKKWANEFIEKDKGKGLLEVINDSDNNAYASYYYSNYTGYGVLELPVFPMNNKDIAGCSHEVLHAVFHLLYYVGVDYVAGGTNEAFTYLMEYIFNEVLDIETYKLY